MPAFFCKLVPPRPSFAADLSPVEADAMKRHALYWHDLIVRGAVRMFALGLVMDPAGAFGIGVMEREDESAVRTLTDQDPAVTAGIGMHYEIHRMPRGVMHN
ncbi:MAG TPA: YciI family protein [Rhodanobacteraceae bacterium]|nr:YciI family protein [Rhodanobacteraceae bacterium]